MGSSMPAGWFSAARKGIWASGPAAIGRGSGRQNDNNSSKQLPERGKKEAVTVVYSLQTLNFAHRQRHNRLKMAER